MLTIECSRFGVLAYGITPAGYDGWSFQEVGGGGSVIIPYLMRGEDLYIGVVRQHRYNQGGEVLNVPRGFLDRGESPHETAIREMSEETGYNADKRKVIDLGGQPANPNSAFFDTSEAGEGVKFFAVEIFEHEIETRDGKLTLRSEWHNRSHLEERLREGIAGSYFIHWTEAAQLADMFSNAAVARLQAFLYVRTGQEPNKP
jgi:8-oxo-dGTP pyrophosphatase MutT (NUDIX family)